MAKSDHDEEYNYYCAVKSTTRRRIAVMSGSDGYMALSLQRDILQFRLSC